MKKDFDTWNKQKKQLHGVKRKEKLYFKEREIWWSSLGVNIGHEQDGKHDKFERPVLILKKFNHNLFWGLPVTSQQKQGRYYQPITYEKEGYQVILSQLRALSSKRLLRKISKINRGEFNEVKAGLARLLGF